MAILGLLLAEEERHPELLQLFKIRLVEPRRALLREALVAGELPASQDIDALATMLIGSFYGRYVTVAGIPDDWPERILNPPFGRPIGRPPDGPVAEDRCGRAGDAAVRSGHPAGRSGADERGADSADRGDPARDRGVVRFEIGLDPADGTRVVGYEIWQSQDSPRRTLCEGSHPSS